MYGGNIGLIARVFCYLYFPTYTLFVVSNKKAMEMQYSEGGGTEDRHHLLLLHDKRGTLE